MGAATVGFIGLGNMGGSLARRLLEGGIELFAFDANADALRRCAAAGAVPCDSAREVGDRANIVMACLPSSAACLAVAQQVAEGIAVQVYAEMSTIGRQAVRAIEDVLRPKGVELLDSPVTGGPPAARVGQLTIIMAGPQSAMDRIAPIFDVVSNKQVRIGDAPGQAQLCKLVNNAISFTVFLVSCEAIAVGVSAGIDPAGMVDVVNAGRGRNTWTLDRFPQFILPRQFNAGAELGPGVKDLDLYLEESEASGMPPGMVARTREIWLAASAAIDPTQDVTTMIRYFENFVGAEVSSLPGRRKRDVPSQSDLPAAKS